MAVQRTKDLDVVNAATAQYKDQMLNFYPDFWLGIPANVALVNDKGDVALFERMNDLDQTVIGHYFFHSRGREAVRTAQEMLSEIFLGPYDVTSIVGLTPLDNKGALWMNRRLGFKHDEEVMTEAGPARFVLLTKQEWELPNG